MKEETNKYFFRVEYEMPGVGGQKGGESGVINIPASMDVNSDTLNHDILIMIAEASYSSRHFSWNFLKLVSFSKL